jgi:hypothetical protein
VTSDWLTPDGRIDFDAMPASLDPALADRGDDPWAG